MSVKIYFEPRDMWVGVFWNKVKHGIPHLSPLRWYELSIYICIIPCFPIRLRWLRIDESSRSHPTPRIVDDSRFST